MTSDPAPTLHKPAPAFGLAPTSAARGALCRSALVLALALTLASAPPSAAAQYRFGISAGGASTVALVAEYRWDHQGVEVQVGSWRFRDASVSVTVKQYVGSYAVEPYLGVGLWGMTASAEAGRGFGLIARLPVGFEASLSDKHSVAGTLYLNRALALRRPDPADTRPPRTALVPLPEFSYRWGPSE